MKRLLAIVLCILMTNVLQLFGFALPMAQIAVENANEQSENLSQDKDPQGEVYSTANLVLYYDDYIEENNVRARVGNITTDELSVPEEDADVLEITDGTLHAIGVGQAQIFIGDVSYTVEVQKANVQLALIMGQSNSVGVIDGDMVNTEGAVECEHGTAYLWQADYTLKHLTPFSGFQNALASELYEQSGRNVKTVVVYQQTVTSERGKPISYWDETRKSNIAYMYNQAVKYFEETNADKYNLVRGGMYWLQGESDQNMVADSYYTAFNELWSAMKSKTNNHLSYCGIFRVRQNLQSRTNIAYTGPVAAQLKMSADNADVFMASTVTENWYGAADTTINLDTSNYRTVSYPETVKLSQLFDGLHYERYGYNVLGADAAYNMTKALDGDVSYTVILGEETGHVGNVLDMTNGGTLDLSAVKENFTLYLAPGSAAGTLNVKFLDTEDNDVTQSVVSGCMYIRGAIVECGAVKMSVSVLDVDGQSVENADFAITGVSGNDTVTLGGRTVAAINNNWRFMFGADTESAISSSTDTSAWAAVSVPHTWNAADGTDGGTNYERGYGWYRKNVNIPADFADKQIFIEFEGANTVSTLYIDGTLVPYTFDGSSRDTHNSGYAAFRYDITDYVNAGQTHLFSVCVDNTKSQQISPIDGDWTFYGGIYRDVMLISTPKVHIDLLDYASDGVYMTALPVDSANLSGDWTFTVKTTLVNETDTDAVVDVKTTLREPENVEWISDVPSELTPFDENTMTGDEIVCTATEQVTVPAKGKFVYTKEYTVNNPRLWNGKADPYRYQADTCVLDGENVLDKETDYIGFRHFSVDKDTGFYLNGVSYPLRGVSRHQDFDGVGFAIDKSHHDLDFGMIYDIGANAIRLAHYPHDDYFYDLCDKYGMVVWAEIPFISLIGGKGEYGAFDEDRTAFVQNVKEQLTEMIRQQYNRPSIMFWGLQNEVDTQYRSVMEPLMEDLYALAKSEDPNRLTTHASFHEPGLYWKSDLAAINFYPGWYGYEAYEYGAIYETWVKGSTTMPPLGNSEYGAGGSIYHHVEDPENNRPDSFGDPFHPEEYQTLVHETAARALNEGITPYKKLDYLWASYVWNMFDFGSDKRSEGDRNGINDKGLVTYDRSVKKDSYYVYKAIWSDVPFVHIQRSRFTVRDSEAILVKVSSNCEAVSLSVNGTDLGQMTNNGSGQFEMSNVPLNMGENTVVVTATDSDSNTHTESVTWTRQKSNSTLISSNTLTVDNDKYTVVLRKAFKASEIASYVESSKNATFAVLDARKGEVDGNTNVLPGMYLRVTAEDGVTFADYIFVENNIAFSKEVTVNGNSVSGLVDGNTTVDAGVAGVSYPFEIDIDLGAKYNISSVLLLGNGAYSFEVRTSNDGANYTLANTGSSGTSVLLKDTSAQFVKLVVTGGAAAISLYELEIQGWRFNTDQYRIDENSRTIITNTAGQTIDTGSFIETLGLSGNMTYTLNCGQYFIADGDILTVIDNENNIVDYTICTGNGCIVKHNFNVALRKPVISNPSYQSVHPASNAIDGKTDTRWAADYYGRDDEGDQVAVYPEVLTVDLQGEYLIDSVDLTMFGYEYGNNRAYRYEILTSLDNVDYEQIVDFTNNNDRSGVYNHDFPNAVLARFVSLNVTGCDIFPSGSKIATAGVYEFKVNGRIFDGTPDGMTLTYDKMILAPGKSERISLKLVPDYASLPTDIKFESANESVATVSEDGVVTGVSLGDTTVTASSESLGFSVTLNVTVGDKKVLSLNRPVKEHTGTVQGALVAENINDGKTWDDALGLDSRWQLNETTYPQAIVIDLERLCKIEGVDITFFAAKYHDRAYGYKIYVSDDNKTYTQITDNSANADRTGISSHTYSENVTARFVKLEITSGTKGSAGVYELTVYGDEASPEATSISFASDTVKLVKGQSVLGAVVTTPANADISRYRFVSENPAVVSFTNGVLCGNGKGSTQVYITNAIGNEVARATVEVFDYYLVSLGKPVSDCSTEGVDEGSVGFKNLTDKLTDGKRPQDGNYNFERWHVPNQQNHYVVVDLQGVYDVKQIDVYFFYYVNRAHGYKLSYSLDGQSFTEICNKLDNTTPGVVSETLENAKARFIKLEVSKPVAGIGSAGSGSTAGVYELEVYGLPLGGVSVESAEFTQSTYTLSVGEKTLNTYVTTPYNADTSMFTFVSSNSDVATLSRAGTITALSVGETEISVVSPTGITLCTATVKVDEYKLVSLNKPVVSYSDLGQPGNQIENLTDGVLPTNGTDTSTARWQATTATQDDDSNHYLTVDLQDVYNISKIDLYFFYYGGRTCGYKLYSSLDGSNFTPFIDKLTNYANGIHTENVSDVTARYIKIEVTKPTSGATPGIYEMSVYGTAVSDENNPTTCLNDVSIRVREPSGLRFMAYVTYEQDERVNNAGDEFGFIVTRKTLLENAGLTETELTFEKAKANNLNIAVGKSKFYDYQKDVLKEIIYDNDVANSHKYFTGVLTGIPSAYYKDVLVARPYILIDGEYFYGESISSDIYSIAEAIYKDTDNPPSDEVMEYIKNILGITE